MKRGVIAGAVHLAALLCAAGLASAQELRLSSRSADAQAAARAGMEAIENELFAQAALHLQRALELDPKLALARAFYATYTPNLPPEQRASEMQQAATDAMNAHVGELLLVLALRAPAGAERRSLLKAAVDAVPDDRHVLFFHAVNLEGVAERVRSLESLNRRFPEFAPAFYQLAFARGREQGDLPAALPVMQRYLRLQPNNPIAHDGYAELLQLAGRLEEAVEHYQHAMTLDPAYAQAFAGRAEVALLQARPDQARAFYQQAIGTEKSASSRLNLRMAATLTFIADDNPRAALAGLNALANDAETAGYTSIAAQAHRNAALVEAAFGNKSLVDSRLRKAESLSSASHHIQQLHAAVAYALSGDVIGARPIANALAETAAGLPSLQLRRQSQLVRAIVEVAAGNVEGAAAEVASAGMQGPLAKLLIAEALKRKGQTAEARALGAEVLASTDIDILSVIARQRAKRL